MMVPERTDTNAVACKEIAGKLDSLRKRKQHSLLPRQSAEGSPAVSSSYPLHAKGQTMCKALAHVSCLWARGAACSRQSKGRVTAFLHPHKATDNSPALVPTAKRTPQITAGQII